MLIECLKRRHSLLRTGVQWLIQKGHLQQNISSVDSSSTEMIRNRGQIKRVLCVAEKNDAAKCIAEIMSNGRSMRREGLSKFNKIYEFDYHLFGQNVSVTMTSVSGHLLGMNFKAPLQKWHSCNPVQLFDAEIEKYCPEHMMQVKRTLEKETRQCQALIIWTDCDREGENIGFEIIDVCKAVKANMQVFRAKFSEITPNSIRRACETLTEPDVSVSDAVDVRQELDLRIGASFTRFQTLRLQKIFPASLGNQLISYGTCQFPTLGFVVERFKAIQAFIPETFFKIKVIHEFEEHTVEFSWKRNRLFNNAACLVLYQICMEDPMATVTSVTSKPKSKWRPLPLDTVELEKLSSRKLKISAKDTMKIAEKLYTQGFISYPRTETNIFPASLALAPLVEQQTQSPDWGTFAERVLAQPGGPNPRQGKNSDQAHPPIHPTKFTSSLQDALGHETVVEIDIAQEKFSDSGLMIIARNYLDVYPFDKWSAKVIPVYEQGSQFQPTAIEMVEGQTSPPQLLSEADLISLMEKHGIGTDATHAEHIETIKSRLYVGLTQDQRFLPGELGMGLVEGYNSMGYEMSKPHLRAEFEADLKLVSERRKDKDTVLQHYIQKYKAVFIASVGKAKKLDEALSPYLGEALEFSEEQLQEMELPMPVRKCPNCGRDMVLKKRKDGNSKFMSCTGYPACRTAVWFPETVQEVDWDDSICPTCQPRPVHMLKFKFRRGSLPPMMPLEFVGCIGGCDETLREVLDLKYLRPGGGGGAPSSGTGPTRPPNHAPPMSVSSWTPPPPPPPGGAVTGRASSNDAIVCNCGQDAILLTVRKTGPNQGRQFYKCNGNSCNFFLWADESGQQGSEAMPPPRSDPPRPSLGFRNDSGDSSRSRGPGDPAGETMCHCSQAAVTRTVQKDGPNKGRVFHTCGKPREQQCGFFQWADENVPPPGSFGSGNNSSGNNSSGFNSSGFNSGYNSSGFNSGYNSSGNNSSGFNSGHNSSGFNSSGFDGGQSSSKKGGKQRKKAGDADGHKAAAKKPRTCGICRQPGHTRATCPQR